MTSDSELRVTRSKRSRGFAIALFAGGVIAVTGLAAQETQAPAQPSPAAAHGSAPAPAAPETAALPGATAKASAPAPGEQAPVVAQPQPADAKSPPAGASRGTTGGASKDHFEPTEKVRADFDVSFPVDI